MLNPKRFYPFALIVTAFLFSCQKDSIENQPPLVNAGTSQLIIADTDSVTLTGSASDMDGKVVAYLWSQVSGPTKTTIINPGAASTIASTFSNGTYVFQLMATDEKGATGVDTVSIVLNRPTVKILDLQPSNNLLEFQLINHNGNLFQGTGGPDIAIEAWTKDGLPFTVRGLLKFDLSSIPSGATIQSASLYLYSYPSPTLNGNFTDANFGSNAMLIQQVASSWSTATATFNNLPSVNTSTQIVIPSTTSSTLDLNVDVKQHIQSMVSSNANYGFLMKMQTETYYCSRIFVSSANTTYLSKHPRLVIVYKK